MDNTSRLTAVTAVVVGYLVVAAGTVVTLVIMSVSGSAEATTEAWVHAVIVAVFAILLALRLRAARAGSRRALIAVGIIAGVLLVANAIESALGLFPTWMRIEMIGIAVFMVAIVLLVVQAVRQTRSRTTGEESERATS
ncbi:hypothetical protein FOE78_08410 [Microlunatus elymi]|uniref:Uncharacterized protein n=1 Tax=Microlunatus elymi TaxID=2596828 RepID=A0A516PXM0_9ACTN|nr:hypothetical protein [Microlunatus elymi]QDP95917.1 hypothetical protein FOE78_08410 [Microlunatus elymi]